jgi:hypothetical protein
VVAIVLRRLLPTVVVCLVVGGCYSFAQPSFHPGDPRDVLVELTRRGVEVESSVAGASACADPGLVANVVHLVVTVPSDRTPRDLYLYTFRSRSWEGSKAPVDACQAEYAAANPNGRVARVDVPTYRALGLDWSDELTTIVRDALEQAATQGE